MARTSYFFTQMKTLLLSLFFVPIFLFSQRESADTTYFDHNGDGIQDTLTYIRSSGSWFSYQAVAWQNGQTEEEIELNLEYYYGSFMADIPLDPFWFELAYAQLKDTFEERLLGREHLRAKPDPSLQWLLDAQQYLDTLAADPLFDRQWEDMIRWQPAKENTLDYYYIELDSAAYAPYHQDTCPHSGGAWMLYTGHNHLRGHQATGPKLLFSAVDTRPYEIYRTHHGIFIKKDDQIAWLFIGDILTGYGGKLRWQSILEVIPFEDRGVFFLVSGGIEGENHIWWADVENETLWRLKLDETWHDVHYFYLSEEGLEFRYYNHMEIEQQRKISWNFLERK